MARASHAAFIVTDLETDERLIIAAGGYQNSTEILIDNVWIQGPDLPVPLNGHTESTVPLGHGQAILGGLSTYISQKKIYVINCQKRDCFVSTMIQELSYQR